MSRRSTAKRPQPLLGMLATTTSDKLVAHLNNLKVDALSCWRDGQDCVRAADTSIQERRVHTVMVPYGFAQEAERDSELMQVFLDDDFWEGTEGRSPKAEDILQRSFEFHFKCTKRSGALYKRCCTYTRAFQAFFDKGVDVDDLPDIIKTAHGIEALYHDAVLKHPRANKRERVVQEDKPASPSEDDEDDEKPASTGASHRHERSTQTDQLAPRTRTKAASHPDNDTIIKQPKPSMRKVDDSDVLIVEKAAEGISSLLENQDKRMVTIQAAIEKTVGDGWVGLKFISASFD